MKKIYDIRDYGAGDGRADDTQAIQDAINAASTSRGVCRISPGTYYLKQSLWQQIYSYWYHFKETITRWINVLR